MNGAKCNLCNAPVRWAKTPAGRSICFNPHPDETSGQWAIEGDPAVCTEAGLNEEEVRYSLHALTCAFRRRAGRAGGK